MAGHATTREEAAIQRLAERVDTLTGSMQRLSTRVVDLESRLPRLPGPTYTDLEGLHEEVAELLERVAALETSPSMSERDEVERLGREIDAWVLEDERLRRELAEMTAERDEARQTAAQATDCLAAARAELLDTRRELETVRADRDMVRRWLASTTSSLERVVKDRDGARQALAAVTRDRDLARASRDEAIADSEELARERDEALASLTAVDNATAAEIWQTPITSTLPPLTDEQRREMAYTVRMATAYLPPEMADHVRRETADILDPPAEG